jgi:nucleotide-binding universal stress UspA family protein
MSVASREALRLAVQIGMRLGARLTLLHVDNSPFPGGSSEAKSAMHRWAALEIPESLHFQIVVDEGVPAERINHHAADGEHDLVVMGTHGKQGLERVILGSVAELVVRTCSVPVLVTHDRQDADES